MSQAPDRQVEELVARLLEPRLASAPPQDIPRHTREAFAQIVARLGGDRERIHRASEAVVLCVARRWGNIVQAGKASVLASRDSAEHLGLSPALAAELATVGAARGVRRVGPVAFSQLRSELCSLVENFDELTALRGEGSAPRRELPVIVPFENDERDFPSAEESWEEELARLRPQALPTPGDLSAWEFEGEQPVVEKARGPRLWPWWALGLVLLLAMAGFLLYNR